MFNRKSRKYIFTFAFLIAISFIIMIFSYIKPNIQPIQIAEAFGGSVIYPGGDGDGEGTKQDPFLIGSYQTLNTTFREMATTANMHYVLISDISITGYWDPITTFGEGSVLDGNGYTINNLNIQSSNPKSLKGLFSTINSCVIKNLYFTNVNIQGGSSGLYLGVIAGECGGRNVEFDNIKVESVTMLTINSLSMAGGIVGRLFGSGISDSNRASFVIKNSYTKSSNIEDGNGGFQAYNGVGGFVGFIQSGNININIQNSFHEGDMNATGVYVGGVIGGVSNTLNKTIIIENCYAKGHFTVSDNNNGYIGGIVGYFNAQAYATPELFINNCFSQITTTEDTSYTRGITFPINNNTKGGIFGHTYQATNPGGVFVNNCVAVQSDTINKLVGDDPVRAEVDSQSELIVSSDLDTQAMADKLNAGANPPNFVIFENRLELRTFDPKIMFVFDSNGGNFSPEQEQGIKFFDLEKGDDFWADWVEIDEDLTLQRIGFEFGGWNTMADGSGENYFGHVKIDTADNLTLYANWQIISYSLSETVFDPSIQTVSFHQENNSVMWTITLNQKGYIKTALLTEDIEDEKTFNSFYVLKKEYYIVPDYETNPAAWVDVGAGYFVSGDNPLLKEQRLDLFDSATGHYLIDENFVELYAIEHAPGEFSFIFKPVYYETEIDSFSFHAKTTSQKSYGMVYIDGVYNPYGAKLNYIAPYGNQIEMKIVANKYRKLKAVLVKVGEEPFSPVETIQQIDYVYSFTFDLIDGMEFEIEFESVEFDIFVIARTKDGIDVPSELNAIINNGPSKVWLNSSFTNVSANNVVGYRLVNNAVQNIKIFNQITSQYDYFSAISGAINFASMDVSFFDKYLDFLVNEDGEIVIIAEYIAQFNLNLEIQYLNESYADVTIEITDEYGNTTIVSQSMLDYFDKNSIVKITLLPDEISLIENITNVSAGELNEDGNIIQFVLDKDRNDIEIVFNVIEYSLNVKLVDKNLNEIFEIEKIVELETEKLFAEDEITLISKGEHPNFEFLGWYAVVGEELILLPAPYDSVIERLVLTQSFIDNYVDGLEINIIGQFIRLHEINVIIPLQNSGTVEFFVLNENEGGKQILNSVFREGTQLRIVVIPNDYYMFDNALGLDVNDVIEGHHIETQVNSTAFITINFKPIIYEFVPINDLKNAKGNVTINNTNLAIGEKIVFTFNPDSGYELANWKINGVDVNDLENVEINGNNLTLTITEEWLQEFIENGGALNSEISTKINTTFLTIVLAGGISIPVLLIFVFLFVFLNSKRKAEYNRLIQNRLDSEKRFASVDFVKKILNDKNDN